MDNNIFIATVSQVNRRVALTLKKDEALSDICVKGEVSNLVRHYKSGHIYFTLKDGESALKCVMFSYEAESLTFEPQNGESVIARGRIQVYERDGVYQLYTTRLEPESKQEQTKDGAYAAFLKLKEKLLAEGIFANQRGLPSFPNKICLITAKDGAALQDILSVLSRRYPVAEVFLIPVLVQGANAANSIISALKLAATIEAEAESESPDVIVLARGGGSAEDLWCFNDEGLSRMIHASKIPVVSAIGHETDFTIADFAADLRAPTPSAAAELITPDLSQIIPALDVLMLDLSRKLESICENKSSRLDYTASLINARVKNLFAVRERELSAVEGIINALNPERVFKRGFAAVFGKDGATVKSAGDVRQGDELRIKLAEGGLTVIVKEAKDL